MPPDSPITVVREDRGETVPEIQPAKPGEPVDHLVLVVRERKKTS